MDDSQVKMRWEGEVVSVQPRSTVWRYICDNRTHREIGYNIFVRGSAEPVDDCAPWGFDPNDFGSDYPAFDFCVAISEKQQEKLAFRIGDYAKGTGWTPLYPNCEFADLYRAGGLKITKRAEHGDEPEVKVIYDDEHNCYDGTPIPRVLSSDYPGPPWTVAPPPLEVYSWRGARMLAKPCWKGKCFTCIWANMANVTVQYNFDTGTVKNRFETFCYGPLSCKNYKMGPARAVPYKGMSGIKDEGWLDEIVVQWRMDCDE
jgi:hypothetical protein